MYSSYRLGAFLKYDNQYYLYDMKTDRTWDHPNNNFEELEYYANCRGLTIYQRIEDLMNPAIDTFATLEQLREKLELLSAKIRGFNGEY